MRIKQTIKNLFISVLFIFLHTPLIAMKTSIDESKLDHIALTQGYGYKYANLRELETLCASLANEPYKLAVPILVGIPSAAIQQFLEKTDNLDLATEWKNLIQKYFSTTEIQKQILKSKQYPDGFLQNCATIEQRIKDAFKQISNNLKLDFNFNSAFNVQGQDISALIQTIAQKKERLMVRSTGKEDTKKLANAGGNESISNIEPVAKEILLAMGDVVASYFGKKSLIQRLGAGDESLFELTPFTPVLIQRMIGEQNPQQLPKCGVMFTEEPEGGISILEIKNSDGSTKTTGITVIQAAYGHNEGVVNSLIPVDTFYVSTNNQIYPIIRPKTYRMSPAAARTLELKKNDGPLVNNPALNADAILVLKKFANLLEKHYQGPMDVEFVVNEQEKIIYIVQARPIVHNPNLPKPSYIINPDAISNDQKIVGSAIGVAGGALRWCSGKDTVVIASTIRQALTMYQDLGVQGTAIQSIIVGEMAPATSHEATTFRSEGKPVVYIKELSAVEQWLQNPETILVVSPQQGLVINWQGTEKSVEALLISKIATHGWVSYPVPPFMSVSKPFAADAQLTEHAIINLLPKAVDAKQFMQTLAEKEITTPWKQYLHIIKTGAPDEVSIVLATLLYEIRDAITRKSKDVTLDEDTQQRIMLLQNYLLSCAHQIKANAGYAQTDPDYTKRLLPIHFLQTLLYQQPTPTEIVDGYSAATLIAKELAVEQKIIQELREQKITPDAFTVQYLKIGQTAMTPELEQQWKQFTLNFANQADKSTKDAFAYLILNLGKLNMLPIWLHTSFAQAYKPELKAPEVAQKLVKEYTKESAFLNQLFEKKAIIDALNIDAFGDPKKFATQWHTFKKDLLNYFLSDTDFIASFKKANNFGKLAALSVMTKFVDTFDISIKAVTGRPKDNVNEIITHFKTMLDGYAALFKTWVTLVPEGAIRYSKRSPLSAYIEFIDKILNKPSSSFTAKDLQSTEFNVSAFTIGSAVDFIGSNIVHPTTLENVFTMTHQCLLAVLSTLNSQAGIKDIILPKLLQTVETGLLTLKNRSGNSLLLIGIEFREKTISVFYNLPLNDHSVQIESEYNKKTSTIKLTINFFGDNMLSRWDMIDHFVWTINLTNIISKSTVKHLSDDGIAFELYINQESNTSVLWETIQRIVTFSYNEPVRENLNIMGTIITTDEMLQEALRRLGPLMERLEKLYGITFLADNSIFELLSNYYLSIYPEKVLNLAFRGLASKHTSSVIRTKNKENSKKLIKELISRGHGLKESLEIIPILMQDKDQEKQVIAFSILDSLVKAGYKEAFETATQVAKKGIFIDNFYIGMNTIEIFEVLLKQEYKPAFVAALQGSSDAIKSKKREKSGPFDADAQKLGLVLLTMLSAYPEFIDIKPTIENILEDQEVSEATKQKLRTILSEIESKK